MYKVMSGGRPDRSATQLPDLLWELLVWAWDTEGGPETRRRPSASIVLGQLKESIDQWGETIIPVIPKQWEESGGYPAYRADAVFYSRSFYSDRF